MSDVLKPQLPIMMVDDEEMILRSYTNTLRFAGFNNIISCNDSRNVQDILAENRIQLLLLDLIMPHVDGEEILGQVCGKYPEIPVIMVTGITEVDTAVNCMRAGAFDYIVKPVERERLITSVRRAIEYKEMRQEINTLKQQVLGEIPTNPDPFKEIITNDKSMRSIFSYIEAIASTSEPVLITGETGVGKELIAHAVHSASNKEGPFVAVNVAGLDDNVFSDTLFGHNKGAFTGADTARGGLIEKAAGGTLFLDEIGDLNQLSQVKLLRLLHSGEYFPLGQDVPKYSQAGIVVATNQKLEELQVTGSFRKDLYYRLKTHHTHIPPLRERLDDIPLLVDHFLDLSAKELGKKKPAIPSELITLLATFDFPGNVRELRSMIYDAVTRHKSMTLSMESFKKHIFTRRSDDPGLDSLDREDKDMVISFPNTLPTLKQAADLVVEEALKRAEGNISIAAQLLAISRQALSARLKKKTE